MTKPTSSTLSLNSPKQKKGEAYELEACRYLQAHGLIVVAKNWLQPNIGELDLVMIEQGKAWDTLVFVEVRGRTTSAYGDAVSSVTKSKQNKLIKTAQYFLQQYPEYQEYECRFDVIGLVVAAKAHTQAQQVDWVKSAFLSNAW